MRSARRFHLTRSSASSVPSSRAISGVTGRCTSVASPAFCDVPPPRARQRGQMYESISSASVLDTPTHRPWNQS